MNNCISKFIEQFKPGENLQKPDEEILNFGKQMLPKEIIELWEEYGFGEYGDGIFLYSSISFGWWRRYKIYKERQWCSTSSSVITNLSIK